MSTPKTIIAKYVDYSVYAIDFFIKELKTNFALRDISGMTSGKVEAPTISKEHPLVALMAASLKSPNSVDANYSSIIPGIGVTPGDSPDEGKTIGGSPTSFAVNQAFMDELKAYPNQEALTQDGQVTEQMIVDIDYKFKRNENVKAEKHQFRKTEAVNISVWTDFPDSDIIFHTMVESILHDIQSGIMGDGSKIKNMDTRTAKGITNFGYGRVLYGAEFAVTFLNSYNNYTIYTEPKATGVEFDITYTTPGEDT